MTDERTAKSNRRASLKLLQLRTEPTLLTQVDAAELESLSSKTVGRYERGEVDMPALRYFIALLEFRERQKGGK